MDERFSVIAESPWNDVFQVVFFPDRVYHAQYLNATRSPRYRYDVHEVRGKADALVLKGEVFLDGVHLTNFLRVEYRGSRLVETAREKGRFLGPAVELGIGIAQPGAEPVEARARMQACPWIDAYQVEFWETLEPPPGIRHDWQVLDMMGHGGSIVREPAFAVLLADIDRIQELRLWFREGETTWPTGFTLSDEQSTWDNYYDRNVQVPLTSEPSSPLNTVRERNYLVSFRRGFFVPDVRQITPVRYRNAMMNEGTAERRDDNIIEMRWILQQEFGGTVVFFHEVTIPPGTVEGTHQHIGSEEVYFVTEGSGVAYMGIKDDPALAGAPEVEREIYGIGPKPCRRVDVKPGSLIYTKSGGIHGIANTGDVPLRFVAFLLHTS
ncbi:MAG: cupin domain-containing protein [Acidobacteria bacterium]|nr:cupin domain-containing protein [Acidobacteriota bacterium]